MTKKRILITNDDGIHAPGIRYLIDIMKPYGDVYVMAPNKPQSGSGHAITFTEPLRIHNHKEETLYHEYSCNGTPVDCVKLAEHIVLKGLPDLVVSGINHGSNASINVIYSGTMAAVIEGNIDGVPSIGFSLDTHREDIDFEPYRKSIERIVEHVLTESLPRGVCLNVNIPFVPKVKGMRVCRQAHASWIQGFDSREDPRGGYYHWLTGKFNLLDKGIDTDIEAIANGYVSIVPIQLDFTAHKSIEGLKGLNVGNE